MLAQAYLAEHPELLSLTVPPTSVEGRPRTLGETIAGLVGRRELGEASD